MVTSAISSRSGVDISAISHDDDGKTNKLEESIDMVTNPVAPDKGWLMSREDFLGIFDDIFHKDTRVPWMANNLRFDPLDMEWGATIGISFKLSPLFWLLTFDQNFYNIAAFVSAWWIMGLKYEEKPMARQVVDSSIVLSCFGAYLYGSWPVADLVHTLLVCLLAYVFFIAAFAAVATSLQHSWDRIPGISNESRPTSTSQRTATMTSSLG
jgi:hypothetical protein